MAEQKRYPTTAELDLEARQQEGYVSPLRVESHKGVVSENQDQYAVKGNDTSGYIGVSPEYMTYANDTEKPLAADSGVEEKVEKTFAEGAPTVVRAADEPKESTATQGTGSSVETVTTALSGSGLKAEVKAPEVTTPAESAETTETPETPEAPKVVKAPSAPKSTTDGK